VFRLQNGQKEFHLKSFLTALFGPLALSFVLAAGSVAVAQDAPQNPSSDNTKTNERDRNPSQPTADQQKENRPDRDITRDVRRAIMQDKSLSSYAHNVKVISQNGAVTLKGPVRSEEEKSAIEAKAAEIVGKEKVTNQLEVKPQQ
jgi:osmotically-inducible protein OsmY